MKKFLALLLAMSMLVATTSGLMLEANAEDSEDNEQTTQTSEEGNHNYAEDEYKLKLFASNGTTYLITRDGDTPTLWWDYCWDSRTEQSTGGEYAIENRVVWNVNLTSEGYYQLIAVNDEHTSQYNGKALAEAEDGSIGYVTADAYDKAQLWSYEAAGELDGGVLVNAATGHVIGLNGDAENGTALQAAERDSATELSWVLQNLTTDTQLNPRTMHNFKNTYFRILSSVDGATRFEGWNGVCIWNTGDSVRNDWKVVPAGDGYFYLESVEYSGTVIAPEGNGTVAGTVIVTEATDNEDETQLWKIQLENGLVRFLNKASGLALGIKDDTVENGNSLALDEVTAAKAEQLWNVTNKTTDEALVPADIPNVLITREFVVENYFVPTKVRVIKEEKYLELYWDREVVNSDVIESYELKNGENVLTLYNPGASSMYFYNQGVGFTSFGYEGEIDEALGLTLEIKGDIYDADEANAAAVEKKVYDVAYENFYTREVIAECGIRCISSDDVAIESLELAAAMIDVMLAKEDSGIPQALRDNDAKMALYGSHENAYFIPEHRSAWNPEMYYVEGYGGSPYNNFVSSIAERNVIRALEGPVTTGYKNENILVHEFGHCVKLGGMEFLEDKTLQNEFAALYKSRMKAGMWPNTYAGSNPDEYFATLSAIWFNVMDDAADWTDGVRSPINTREELKEYDPEAYEFFAKIYPSDLSLPEPWENGSVPDNYQNPEGGGIVLPEASVEGNHNYATDEFKMKLYAMNGNTYLITRDNDTPYLWWNYSWDSREEQSTGGSYAIDDTNVWNVNRTEEGYYQLIAVDATYDGKALAEAENGSIVYVAADLNDKLQLWNYEAVGETDCGIFVNVSTGHAIGLAGDAADGTFLQAVDQGSIYEASWALQNLTTNCQLYPREAHDFENKYFSIISAEDGASRVEGWDGVCIWNTGDSIRNDWKIVPAGEGYFYIESVETPGQVLAPEENGTTDSTIILPEAMDEEDDTQLWKIQIEEGYIRFLNKASGLAMGIQDDNVANGSKLALDDVEAGKYPQLWKVTNKATETALVPADIPNIIAVEEAGLLGDVDLSGTVDTTDAQAIFNYFMGISVEDQTFEIDNADINGDGFIDTSDAQAAFNIFMGI